MLSSNCEQVRELTSRVSGLRKKKDIVIQKTSVIIEIAAAITQLRISL